MSDRSAKDPTQPPDTNGGGDEPNRDSAYVAMHSDPRFVQLKRNLFAFIVPASLAFMAWYVLYVLMSAFGRDVMGTVLFGNVNVALVFGALQFVSTFGIAVLYTRYARKRLDTAAIALRDELQDGTEDKEAGR